MCSACLWGGCCKGTMQEMPAYSIKSASLLYVSAGLQLSPVYLSLPVIVLAGC
jgi:hypothetical protein